MSKTPFTGGCVCGAVRYECNLKPLAMFKCHCRTCQMVSGGPYTPVVLVSRKAFRLIQGELRYHFTEQVKGGHHKRGFCAACGSRITGGEAAEPGRWLAVTASSLDDPSLFQSEYDIFSSHAQPWDRIPPEHVQYPEYPVH